MTEKSKPSSEALVRDGLRAEIPAFLRDALLGGLAVFLLCGGSVLLIYLAAISNESERATSALRQQAEFLASLIPPTRHAQLVSSAQNNSATHRDLSERLQNARSTYTNITELFTGRWENGTVRVIVDTHTPSPDRPAADRQSIGRTLPVTIPADSPEGAAIVDRRVAVLEMPRMSGGQEGSRGVVVPLGGPGSKDFLFVGSRYAEFSTNLKAIETAFHVALAAAGLAGLLTAIATYGIRYRLRFRQELAVMRLRESEELFRSTYALSPVAMVLTDTEEKILRANQAFCNFLGFSETSLIRKNLLDFCVAEDLEREEPLLQSLRHHRTSQYTIEKRYLRKDGAPAWGLTGVAIVRDSDGVSSHFMIQVVDITERKKGEEVLRVSQERLTLAAEAGRVGIWDTDLKSGTTVWNDVMFAIYRVDQSGYTPTLARQMEFIHSEERVAVHDQFKLCVKEGSVFQCEYRIVVEGKDTRYVRSRAVIFSDGEGVAVRAIGTTVDITAEKEEAQELIRAKEAALAADRAKSEFLAVMSHEIRTPLNGVLGFVSMLKHTPLNEEQISFIDTMESSGQRLLALVNDILNLSKIESGEVNLDYSVTEIRPFVQEIHRQLEARAWEKKLRYQVKVDDDVPKLIFTDATRLGQILTNLLGNALKFTEQGSVELHVAARESGTPGRRWVWRFTVTDTGPGIPAESAMHLSKLFYQVDSSSTRRHEGTGLGLAISCRLAGLLGGVILVQSKLGAGSEFTLEMRTPDPDPKAAPGPAVAPRLEDLPLSKVEGKHVLVVEDNAVNRKLCALQLKRLGAKTDFAVTGREAVNKAAEGGFQIILMDMHLPDLDGCDATREIRKLEKAESRVPIIALTANAMPEDRKKCFDAGMDDFLSKPLQIETLAYTLTKWL